MRRLNSSRPMSTPYIGQKWALNDLSSRREHRGNRTELLTLVFEIPILIKYCEPFSSGMKDEKRIQDSDFFYCPRIHQCNLP